MLYVILTTQLESLQGVSLPNRDYLQARLFSSLRTQKSIPYSMREMGVTSPYLYNSRTNLIGLYGSILLALILHLVLLIQHVFTRINTWL